MSLYRILKEIEVLFIHIKYMFHTILNCICENYTHFGSRAPILKRTPKKHKYGGKQIKYNFKNKTIPIGKYSFSIFILR